MDCYEAFKKIESLSANLEKVIRGKREIIELAVTALLAEGHLLIEDVPGVGKTTLAHGLAKSINCAFQRIQFTSDMLPSDVIGVTVYRSVDHAFEFRHGPIFANIVLADEINRTTPKTQSALLEAMNDRQVSVDKVTYPTQSALLEAMNDRQVSVDKVTYPLPRPFMLLATQNPFEFSGTYPLPESQLDRFTMCISIGYPEERYEREIIHMPPVSVIMEGLAPVLTSDEILKIQDIAKKVRVEEDLVSFILSIAAATRRHKDIRLGVSPRGTMTLYRTAQALALVKGRDYCIPDDIKSLALPVFTHRIIPETRGAGEETGTALMLMEDILSGVSVPI
ncbi:MAG: MoxR family ATPase [Deltaproteobacteria bacterium]|nr:MoxR family ATPase [Deltaproteobacteria bacterium]